MSQSQANSTLHGEFANDIGLVDKRVVARVASLSLRTIDNPQREKKIPFIKLSARCVRYHLPSVLAALRRFEVHEVGRARAVAPSPGNGGAV